MAIDVGLVLFAIEIFFYKKLEDNIKNNSNSKETTIENSEKKSEKNTSST